ncbi:MAG: 30S ribosomal protein S7 [Candidatus Lokiarchaeota archaeon]|nr:30S ribosomal protein S7 [Candidatus Lokiarchaeota archaeon]
MEEKQVDSEIQEKEEELKPEKLDEALDASEPEEEEDGTSRDEKSKKKSTEIKLFNRWSFESLEVPDPSLERYINLNPVIIPHSGGKHEHKRFWKTLHVSFVERFINKILAPGLVRRRIKGRGSAWNAGKKQKILGIIQNAFTIIEQKTGDNPLQVLIDAIVNAAPREETTKISLGGISYQTAVDIAPQRRVDLAIRLLVQGAVGQTYNSLKTIDECIANEIIYAARNDQNSRAIKRKDEMERIAISAR